MRKLCTDEAGEVKKKRKHILQFEKTAYDVAEVAIVHKMI
jgi:hypothetical protein